MILCCICMDLGSDITVIGTIKAARFLKMLLLKDWFPLTWLVAWSSLLEIGRL